MGCPVHHEIWNETEDLYDQLEKDGIIHDGMLDYGRCDLTTLEEVVKEHLESDKDHGKPKYDYRLTPVHRTEEGGVLWVLNYCADDFPSVAISRHFPDEALEYREYGDSCMNQGRASVYCHCILKNNKVVRDFVKEENEKREQEEKEHSRLLKEKFDLLKEASECEDLDNIINFIPLNGFIPTDKFTIRDIVELYGALIYKVYDRILSCENDVFGEKLLGEDFHKELKNKEVKHAPNRINKLVAPF